MKIRFIVTGIKYECDDTEVAITGYYEHRLSNLTCVVSEECTIWFSSIPLFKKGIKEMGKHVILSSERRKELE